MADAGGSHRRPAVPELRGLKLGDRDGEPLDALVAEVHLHAGVAALSLGVDDHATAELRMGDVLPDAKAADVARRLAQRNRFLFFPPREILLAREARRQPLH